jgi:hypothetical protein
MIQGIIAGNEMIPDMQADASSDAAFQSMRTNL